MSKKTINYAHHSIMPVPDNRGMKIKNGDEL